MSNPRGTSLTTTIVLKRTTYERLANYKIVFEEPFDNVISRLLEIAETIETDKFMKDKIVMKDVVITTETNMDLEKDLNNYVKDNRITDEYTVLEKHRDVWRKAHPTEELTSKDHIHHINQQHMDNRPENLMKVTPKEHSIITGVVTKANNQSRRELVYEAQKYARCIK